MNADPTVAEWLEGYRDLFPGQRSLATILHDRYMVAPFTERYGRRKPAGITPMQAQAWAMAHPTQVRYLRHAWSKALLMGLVPLNVWRLVELPPRTNPPRPVPTEAQLEAILARCRGRGGWWLEYADLIDFAAHTGARSGGVAGLTRSDVDLVNRRVTLSEKGAKGAKGAKARRVATPRRAAAALERQLERHPWTERVWRGQDRQRLDRNSVGRAWRAVRGDFPGPFHSLRHYAGTWLAGAGVCEDDIAVQLGHTDSEGRPYTRVVRRVYVHRDSEDALERIELACGDGL